MNVVPARLTTNTWLPSTTALRSVGPCALMAAARLAAISPRFCTRKAGVAGSPSASTIVTAWLATRVGPLPTVSSTFHTSPATAEPVRLSVLALVVSAPPPAANPRTTGLGAGLVTGMKVKVGVNAPPLRLTMTRKPPSPMALKSATWAKLLSLMRLARARTTASRPSPLPTVWMKLTPFRSTWKRSLVTGVPVSVA